jgi:hypothetical protein
MLERALATGLLTLAILGPLQAWASITEVIDETGDGTNALVGAGTIAFDCFEQYLCR